MQCRYGWYGNPVWIKFLNETINKKTHINKEKTEKNSNEKNKY